jgi:hypothetical protein
VRDERDVLAVGVVLIVRDVMAVWVVFVTFVLLH